MLDAFRACHDAVRSTALHIDAPGYLLYASYIDNIVSMGETQADARRHLVVLEQYLMKKWNLRFKDGSREVLVIAGSPEADDGAGPVAQPCGEPRWRRVTTLSLLGMQIAGDATVTECWRATRRGMWRSFWANGGCADARRVDPLARCRLVDRATWPVLAYRAARYPPGLTWLRSVAAVQSRMYALALRTPPLPSETREAYARRRGRAAGRVVDRLGRWDVKVRDRAREWLAHLLRHSTGASWAAKVLPWRGMEWLRARRAQHGTMFGGGRTQTRARPGPVPTRWHDAVEAGRRDTSPPRRRPP